MSFQNWFILVAPLSHWITGPGSFRVVVVHAFIGEGRADLIDPIAGSRQLPYLRHAVLHTVVDEYLGPVVFAVLIVENQVVAAYDLVIGVGIDFL